MVAPPWHVGVQHCGRHQQLAQVHGPLVPHVLQDLHLYQQVGGEGVHPVKILIFQCYQPYPVQCNLFKIPSVIPAYPVSENIKPRQPGLEDTLGQLFSHDKAEHDISYSGRAGGLETEQLKALCGETWIAGCWNTQETIHDFQPVVFGVNTRCQSDKQH